MPAKTKERRNYRLSLDIEETIYSLMECVADENDIPMAGYVRSCIIKDLKNREMLTQDVLLRLVGAS